MMNIRVRLTVLVARRADLSGLLATLKAQGAPTTKVQDELDHLNHLIRIKQENQ